MPVSYEFTDPEGKGVLLTTVDEEVCAEAHVPCSPDHYSPYYDFILHTAIGALLHSGGFTLTAPVLEEHLSEMYREPWPPGFTAEGVETCKALARKFLIEKYTFKSWRGGF